MNGRVEPEAKAFRNQNILTPLGDVPITFSMNAPAPPPEETDYAASRAEALRDLAALRGIAMGMARALERAVLEPADPGAPPPAILGRKDPALSFARIANAVRQIVALETMVEEGRLKQGRPSQRRQVSDIAGIRAALGIKTGLPGGANSSPGPLECHGASAPRNHGEGAAIKPSAAASSRFSRSLLSGSSLSRSSRGALAAWRSRAAPPAAWEAKVAQIDPLPG